VCDKSEAEGWDVGAAGLGRSCIDVSKVPAWQGQWIGIEIEYMTFTPDLVLSEMLGCCMCPLAAVRPHTLEVQISAHFPPRLKVCLLVIS